MKIRPKINRSIGGNALSMAFLIVLCVFTALPLVFVVSNAFKPLDELFVYPPKFFVRHPVLTNFKEIFILAGQSWVPFTRYIFNTVFITVLGTAGNVFITGMAAYIFAKHSFPFGRFLFGLVVLALMFSPAVTAIPNYIIMTKLHLIDNYLSMLLPALQYSLGLYLLKQFMETIPDEVLESARIDGAGEFRIFWVIAMPMVKPAWLTLIILMVQSLWNAVPAYTFSEQLKTLPQALSQILAGGIARTGAAAAASLIMMLVPLTAFILSQANIIETMSTSGMKG